MNKIHRDEFSTSPAECVDVRKADDGARSIHVIDLIFSSNEFMERSQDLASL